MSGGRAATPHLHDNLHDPESHCYPGCYRRPDYSRTQDETRKGRDERTVGDDQNRRALPGTARRHRKQAHLLFVLSLWSRPSAADR